MKFSERVSVVLLVIGFALKTSHIQGGDIILISALAGLCLLYFPLGFYSLKKPETKSRFMIPSIVYGFVLSTMVIGLFFRLMILPGGEAWQVICAPIWLIVLGIILYKYLKATDAKMYYKNILIKSGCLVLLNLILFMVPTKTMIDLFYGTGTPESEQMKNHYDMKKEVDGYY